MQGYEASKNDQPIQPTVGVFNEVALQRYDLLLAEAARNNIKLILALSNWWDEQGGVRAPTFSEFPRISSSSQVKAGQVKVKVRAQTPLVLPINLLLSQVKVDCPDPPEPMSWSASALYACKKQLAEAGTKNAVPVNQRHEQGRG